jgi:hypothetical protein
MELGEANRITSTIGLGVLKPASYKTVPGYSFAGTLNPS